MDGSNTPTSSESVIFATLAFSFMYVSSLILFYLALSEALNPDRHELTHCGDVPEEKYLVLKNLILP
ncbi:hypothetical protein KSP40_PGU013864 [Platanthera guangdongensis]|uniref:Uncharacterized protein n=1 Tax=Platanthera guangdongensis TaxID=2320717 RepID=A0ABR2MS15_9ASPA